MKYEEAVPEVIRLLQGGGAVWTGDCEAAYTQLARCRVEKVRNH
jgi:hypothetical protein